MNVIECRGVTKYLGDVKALDKISFMIETNTITGIIGRNGAGKTSLLKTISGLWRPNAGKINVFAENPFNSLLVSANTIFIDDAMRFPDSLGLWKILQWASKLYPNWDQSLAERLFDYFRFDKNQRHGHLSKGNKSTFNIIIGLASRCPLTIFDEPTTGMDASVRSDFYRALLKDYLAHPRTILLSSHHLEEIEHLLEDVLLVDQGACKLHVSIEALKEYAIALSGPEKVLAEWVGETAVLYEKHDALDYVYRVIQRDALPTEVLMKLEEKGVSVYPVNPADLCVYLTNQTKGGIDDVFAESVVSENH